MARLSLCLLSSLAFAVLVLPAPAAQAIPPKPALTATNPASSKEEPAESLEPFLIGKGEPGVETQVVHHPAFLAGGPGTLFTQHPEYEIEIFAETTCQGPVVATGTAEELEDTGIAAPAKEDAVTEFSAWQVDPSEPGEPSKCSLARKYWEGNPPPESEEPAQGGPGGGGPGTPSSEPSKAGGSSPERPAPPRLRTVPGGRANDNTPLVGGSAPSVDSVRLYANSSCSGPAVANVSPSELSAGVPLRVADDSVTDFTGIAVNDNDGMQSLCSPPATYIEDSSAPRTRITMGPGSKTRRHKAVFRFADTSGDPAGTSFVCKVDKHKWKPCHSPFKLRHLGFQRYVLRVRGTDATGNAETKPAKRSFKVIR